MSFSILRGLPRASLAILACLSSPAYAEEEDEQDPQRTTIVVNASRDAEGPATRASIEAGRIETTVNAVNVEDSLKYLPSLVVRKRHIGDTQAPLATRTSGLGASARSLIYADGVLLSALIGNNNITASPRWSMVGAGEVERIDVLYGPFSAAYAGNSMGAVVEITTRTPEKLEGSITALSHVQNFDQYGTKATLPAWQMAASLGGKVGPLSLFGSVTHTDSQSHPLSYVSAARPAAPGSAGPVTSGGYDTVNRFGAPVRILGATGMEAQRQDMFKLKAVLDLGSTELRYVGGLFLDDTDAGVQSYLRNAAGAPLYSGAVNLDGRDYNIAANAFSGGLYTRDSRHWSHALSASGGGDIRWKLIGALYDFDRDEQRSPGSGVTGAGNIVRLNGTGWKTLDARASWRGLRTGAHWDSFTLASNRYSTNNWRGGPQGALNLASRGKTETYALWGEGIVPLAPSLKLTLGGRYEWWRAFDGLNFSVTPALSVNQPERTAEGFSPKASLAWNIASDWTARLSLGKAYRFPTVGELYQAVTTGASLSVPDPTLRPERAFSQELALEHKGLRLSLFNESVEDALISQSAPLVPGSTTLYSYVQNVGRTRARGVELAADRRDVLPGVDVTASATYTDTETRENAALPASVGKMLPSVPRWKASAAITWHPDDRVSLTAGARYASRNWGTLDNTDTVGNTWQGFHKYLVVDARANFNVSEKMSFALGIDNLTNDQYFMFHPFPHRSVTAEVTLRL